MIQTKSLKFKSSEYHKSFFFIFLILIIFLISGCALKPKQDLGLGYSTETTQKATRLWQDDFKTANFIDSLTNLSHTEGLITLQKDDNAQPKNYAPKPNTVINIYNVDKTKNYGAALPVEKGTIELWVKGDFLKSTFQPFVNDYGTNQVFIRGTGAGRAQVAIHDSSKSRAIFVCNFPITSNRWNFISVSWDMVAKIAKVYVNGICIKSGTIENPDWKQSTSPIKLGSAFDGQISNFRILNSVLSESDIYTDYQLIQFKSEGKIVSLPIEPVLLKKWGLLNCDIRTKSSTNVKICLEYYDGKDWKMIPENDLAGNVNGFSAFPVNLDGLNPLKFKKIRINAQLRTSDLYTTPEIKQWSISNDILIKQRPFLFVNADLIPKIKSKTNDLLSLNNMVKNLYQKNAQNLSDDSSIVRAVNLLTDPVLNTNYNKYVDISMSLGIDAFFNDDQLSIKYANEYILSILRRDINVYPNDAIGYGRLYALGTLYDFINNNISDETKQMVRKYILDQIDYLDSKWMMFSMPLLSGGHSRSANGMALLALLSISPDIYKDDLNIQNKFNYYYEKIVGNWRDGFNPMQEWIAENGGYHMGWSYGATYTDPYPYVVWKFASNNETWLKTWQNEMVFWYLYGLRNSNTWSERTNGGYDNFEYFGDTWSSDFTYQMPNILVGCEFYNNSYGKWLYNKFEGTFPSYWGILYKNFKNNDGTSPDNLPMSRFFKNAGFVVMRDSWNLNDNTLVTFKSTSFASENHQHKDQNSFTIFYKGPLAIDSGGYECMGAYGSKHWWNYYTRTVAHNTMLIYDKNESFGSSNYGKNSNDGGQKFFSYGYPTLEQIKDNGENHIDGIQKYEEKSDYTYTMGDATKAYSAHKLDKFERSIINLRNYSYNHPVIIIYDKVVSKNVNFKKTYLLHSINEPDIESNVVTFKIDDGLHSDNKAVLSQKTLLPVNCIIDKIGGQNQRFYVQDDGNGSPHNYDEGIVLSNKRALREAGEWRIEVTPGDNNIDDRFLNVISVRDGGINGYQENMSEYVTGLNFDGAIINDADNKDKILVLFQKEPGAVNDVIDLNNKLQFNKILVVGLTPNEKFELSFSSNKLAIKNDSHSGNVASDQGVIYKTVANN